MASITSWVRLEPRTLDAELAPGVDARLHDPLWLLARQWQFGELAAEDGGSAITARARFDLGRVHGIEAGQHVVPYDGIAPVPALAEAIGRSPSPLPDLEDRARTGRRLVRMLGTQAAGDFIAAFPIAVDAQDEAILDARERDFLALLRGRVPDGVAIAAALRNLPALPAGIPSSAATIDACTRWLAWFDTLEHAASTAWRPDHLEYAFALQASHAGRELRLTAAEHHGGDLGWWSFDATDAGASTTPPVADVATAIPSPVRYRGMPARRYWDLEDGAVSWGAIDAAPSELGRMLLVEYALGFSDDWLVMPIAAANGSLVEIRSLVVTDVFGERTLVRPATEAWRGFTVAGTNALLVLPGTLALDGSVIERVRFARSELSNLAWGVEERRRCLDGSSRDVPNLPAAAPTSHDRYVLGPPVPAGWHPYRTTAASHGTRLVRAAIPGNARAPMTAVIEDAHELAEVELAAGDPCIETRAHVVRDADGRYHVWRARRRTSTRAGTSITVRFDQLEGAEP